MSTSDRMMAFGALPLGHAHPEMVEAITAAATTGAHFAAATPMELEVAEMLQTMVPNAERVRFANTGTQFVNGRDSPGTRSHRTGENSQVRGTLPWMARRPAGEFQRDAC